jgi:hypothetical protein
MVDGTGRLFCIITGQSRGQHGKTAAAYSFQGPAQFRLENNDKSDGKDRDGVVQKESDRCQTQQAADQGEADDHRQTLEQLPGPCVTEQLEDVVDDQRGGNDVENSHQDVDRAAKKEQPTGQVAEQAAGKLAQICYDVAGI